jgi:hypothetical protein
MKSDFFIIALQLVILKFFTVQVLGKKKLYFRVSWLRQTGRIKYIESNSGGGDHRLHTTPCLVLGIGFVGSPIF